MHTQKDVGHDAILQLCKKRMRDLDSNAIMDTLPKLLQCLGQSLDMGELHLEQENLIIRFSQEHGAQRARIPDYHLRQIIQEYNILRRVLVEVLQEEYSLSWQDSEIVQDCIQTAMEHAAVAFQRARDEDICAELEMERHKLQTIFKESPAAMALWRGPDLIFEMVNPGYQTIFPGRELLNRPFVEALPELKDQGFPELLRRVFDTGEPYIGHEVLAQLRPHAESPLEDHYYDFTYVRVNDAKGNPYGVYDHAVDVTARRLARLRLEENEKQIRTYAESLPVMASIADADGAIIYNNQRYYDYFGLAPGTSLEWSWAELKLIHPEDSEKAWIEWRQALQSTQPYEGEYRLKRFDGEYRWHLWRVVPALDQDGRTIRWYGTIVDIHEQKKTQERLAAAREELYQFFMQAPAAMVVLSGPEHHYTIANPAYERLVGRPVSGKEVLEVFTLEEVAHFKELLDEVYRTGVPYIGTELPLNIPDEQGSTQHHFINVGYHPFRDEEGIIIGIFAVHQDVTVQVEARKIVEEQESRFRMLANSMPHMIWTAMPDGSIDWFNDWWYEYTGSERSIHWTEQEYSIHPDDLESTTRRWEEAFLSGESYEMQFRFRRKKDGQYRWHLGRAVPVREKSGKIVLWLGTNTDIHDQKVMMQELELAKAEAERANAAKGAFLANMSHEIRTPLGAIIGFVDLLKVEALPAREREQILEIMQRNGQSLTRIIDDILDLAKVESGKMDIEKQDFSFSGLLDEVIELFRDQTLGKKIYLHAHVQDGVPERIFSDQTRLRQILINIVGNAIKFTHEGGVTLDVRVEAALNERVFMTIKVKDTGIGISPEQKKRLFQPFMQADSSTTRNFGGTGLGLALSKRLANALDGDIQLDGEDATQGSTFIITFFAGIAPDCKTKISSPPPTWGELPLRGLKILLADDAMDNQYLTERLLTNKGATVDVASNGIEALRMGLQNRYDLVLMDVQMPEMDGYEATRLLREAGFHQPIIALTAHAMVEERVKSHDMGCDGHLTKPLNQTSLVETIRQLVPLTQA